MNVPVACAKLGRSLPFPPPPGLNRGELQFDNLQAVVNEADCTSQHTPTSCLIAGAAYLSGIGVLADATRSSTYLKSACQSGLQQACREIDCAAGAGDRCEQAGNAYAKGDGVFVSRARAALLLKKACDAGRPTACQSLSQLTSSQPAGTLSKLAASQHPTMDFTTNAAQGCDAGASNACRLLGDMFLLGIDLRRDPDQALKLYDLACNFNDAETCTDLGRLYRDNPAIHDDAKAHAYLTRAFTLNSTACQIGFPPFACYRVGMAEALGEGVQRDLGKALQNLDYDCSFWKAGFICRDAKEVRTQSKLPDGPEWKALPKGSTALAQFIARDCDSGGAASCDTLATFYQNGHGLSRDIAHATALYKAACDAEIQHSCQALTALGGAAAIFGAGNLCNLGDPASCVSAGDAILKAQDASQYDAASGYYEHACMVHEPGGCPGLIALGDLFVASPDAPSQTRARQLYRTACVLDHPDRL